MNSIKTAFAAMLQIISLQFAFPAHAEQIDVMAIMRDACKSDEIKDKVLNLIEKHRGKQERAIALFEIERDCAHFELSDKPKSDTADASPEASHTRQVSDVHFSADGKALLSASYDGTVRLWDMETGKPTLRIDVPAPPPEGKDEPRSTQIGHAIFFHNGTKIAVSAYKAPVRMYDTATGKQIGEVPYELTKGKYGLDPILGGTVGPMILMATDMDTILGFDLEKNAVTYKTPVGASEATGMALNGATQTMAIGTHVGASLRKRGEIPWNILNNKNGRVTAMAFSPDGGRFAAGMDNEVVVFDVAARKELLRFKIHPLYSVTALKFTKDGSGIITCQSHPILWDVASGKVVRHFGPFVDACTSIDVSPDGKLLASSSGNSPDIRIWDIETGAFERRLGQYQPPTR